MGIKKSHPGLSPLYTKNRARIEFKIFAGQCIEETAPSHYHSYLSIFKL